MKSGRRLYTAIEPLTVELIAGIVAENDWKRRRPHWTGRSDPQVYAPSIATPNQRA